MLIQPSDLIDVGAKLQSVNAEIKNALAQVGAAGGRVPYDVAVALNNLQVQYEKARGLYTDVYRAVWGDVPQGLGQIEILGAPLAGWMVLAVMLAAGGIIYQLVQALRDAIQKWREGQAGALQSSKIQTLQQNIAAARAAGDASAVALYEKQLAELIGQTPGGGDWSAWLQNNLLLVAGGVLVLVIVLKR